MRRFASHIPRMFAPAAASIIVALGVHAQSQAPPGAWTQKAPMPAIRGEVAAAAVGDRLFALGGGVAGKAVPRNEEYDPAADRWRARAPVPQARDHLGVAAVDGKIYAFGGFTASVHQGAGEGAFEYDATSDSWRTLAPMKGPRASVGVAVLDGKIHVIGGRGLDAVTVATHKVYDPANAKWSTNFHADHHYRNSVFKAAGATIIAHADTTRIMQQVDRKEFAPAVLLQMFGGSKKK